MGKLKGRQKLSVNFSEDQSKLKLLRNFSENRNFEDVRKTDDVLTALKQLKLSSGKITKKKNILHTNKSTLVAFNQVYPVPAVSSQNERSIHVNEPIPGTSKECIRLKPSKQLKLEVRSKKGRHALRKELFKQKIEKLKKEAKDARETKKRESTIIVGDLKPMFDALPEFTQIPKAQVLSVNNPSKAKKKFKVKERAKEIDEALAYFGKGMASSTSI